MEEGRRDDRGIEVKNKLVAVGWPIEAAKAAKETGLLMWE